MAKIVLFETEETSRKFLPLTYTRAIADIRFGMMTLVEKWVNAGFEVSVAAADHIVHALQVENNDVSSNQLFLHATICPSKELVKELKNLGHKESIKIGTEVIAFYGTMQEFNMQAYLSFKSYNLNTSDYLRLNLISDIFSENHDAILMDYETLTIDRQSALLDETCTQIGENLFIAEGVEAKCAIFNTTEGPIFIDKNAKIMEGSMLRGPLYIGEQTTVKMGAKIYGGTTIGPHCKVGGEISNSVIFGYTNKGHDGFLGNSILGEWCNLGADTNTSNLKNNYGQVKTWSYVTNKMENTGLTFHGLIMGDHSKSGINTMFNTGTIVGVCANIFGDGFPPKFIPSFSWGGKDGLVDHDADKAIITAKAVYARRKKDLSLEDESILRHIFKITVKYRT